MKGRMLAAERQQKICQMLDERLAVTVNDICRECGVSAVTVRGDLDQLESEGHLKRTHGGAVPVSHYVVPKVMDRIHKNARAKQSIARIAADLVNDDEMVLVGSGTTTLEFVRALAQKRGVTVITNDCHILEYSEKHLPELTVCSTGGELGRAYRHYFGRMLAASLADTYVDKVFLGADGFEPGFGFCAEYKPTVDAKLEFMRHARTKIVMLDSTKVGNSRSFVRFASPTDVDLVIMDRDPKGQMASAIAESGAATQLLLANG